ncbi:MAG: nickel-dependent lactate racemase [bacterium]|nr:nickel-dependent lactate racemase [bacterium]
MNSKKMQILKLPYGQGFIEFGLPKDKVQAVLSPKLSRNRSPERNIIMDALKNPVNSPPLRELVKGKKHILIITNDNTRPNTSRLTFPLLLEEIKLGNPITKITTLIATGLHSKLTEEEMEEKFSSNIRNNIDIITHDAYNEVVYLSKLSTGTEFWINKAVLESDLIIAEGNIEPHFFAGFTGGSKSILPGISGYKTVFSNHSAQMIDHPRSRNGILEGNPIYTEMCEAASKSGLSFILNVVLGKDGKIVKAFSGDPTEAHKMGAEFIKDYTLLPPSPAEIVITSNSGYPLDRNVYQLVRGISVAAETAKPGGVIIIVAECRDGIGHSVFYKLLSDSSSPSEILERIRSKEIYCADQWQVQILAKILENHKVIVVSDRLDKDTVEAMQMLYASSIEEALDIAFRLKGKESKITIVPEGPKTIIQGGINNELY